MKFKLDTACSNYEAKELPLLESLGFRFLPITGTPHFRKDDLALPEIEIATPEDFVTLANRVSNDIIVDKDGRITIYDGYIE